MRNTSRNSRTRRGAIVVLTAFLLVFMLILVALAVDLGYLLVAKTELQHAADAAALAAVPELMDNEALSGQPDMTDEIAAARIKAVQFAAANKVRRVAPVVDSNTANSTSGDVVIGYLANPSDPNEVLSTAQMDKANAVQVTVRRTAAQNGEVGLFFARIMGKNSGAVEATATAAMVRDFSGFEAPDDGTNIPILPIALKVDSWNEMLTATVTQTTTHGNGNGNGNGNTTSNDEWSWNEDTSQVEHNGDKIIEINLYPESTTSPGNVGTVDVGTADNSTSDLARQIQNGVSPQDMSALPGGKLELGSNGTTTLNGDTGISASIQNDLYAVRGQPRIIPLYSTVANPGDNATFTIVGFVGIRVVDVDLTGALKNKRVTIQAANIQTKGGIRNSNSSSYVYSRVWLVR